VVVVQSDRRAVDAVRLGFEREGLTVVTAERGDQAAGLVDEETGLVVAGAEGAEAAREMLGALHGAVTAPILWVGNGVTRQDAWAAGADEVLPQPAYLRDVVTIGKLLSGRRRGHRSVVNGDLADYFGVFYLVRALAATGRSGVLTLVRGLRRAEVRFYEGEVTSAHMGGLHGQAGLHQLLLWTEARFEWRHEPVVQRRQIPLPHDEVLEQAERFLHDIRDAATGLSPACVYEQDVAQIQAMAKKLPTEVHGVLRLFDGNRTVADVLEDSPFRVFETLRVATRAVEAGLIKRVEVPRAKASRKAVLAVEEWLVGDTTRDAVIERTMQIPDTAPGPKVGDGSSGGKKKYRDRKRARERHSAERKAVAPPAEIDWDALLPKATTVDMSTITGVVPSASTSGEIEIVDDAAGAIAARLEGREGLEALTDAEQRKAMFPTVTVAIEPEPEPEPPPPEPEPAPAPTAAAPEPVPVAAPISERDTAKLPQLSMTAPAEAPAEPAVLTDLAAASAAIARIAEREHKRAASSSDATTQARAAEVAAVRADAAAAHAHAAHFTDDEEAFFKDGHRDHAAPPAESFADLDEGYRPPTFWDRLLGRRNPQQPKK
jgi:hypothetical protein